jgi:hypothetical protein
LFAVREPGDGLADLNDWIHPPTSDVAAAARRILDRATGGRMLALHLAVFEVSHAFG